MELVASPIADSGVIISIPALPNTFVEIDYGHSPPSADSRSKWLLSVTSESMCRDHK